MSISNYNFFVSSKKTPTTFGENLKRLRKERGLSQTDLAKLAGLKQRMIVYYESEGGNPPINKIKGIADALKVDITALLLDNKQKVPASSALNFADINTKTIKRIKQLLSLTPEERHVVYALLDSLETKK